MGQLTTYFILGWSSRFWVTSKDQGSFVGSGAAESPGLRIFFVARRGFEDLPNLEVRFIGVSPNYVTPSNPQQIIIGCFNFLAATKDTISIHITLKTNMSPENWCLEDDISFWNDPISRDIRSFCHGEKKHRTFVRFLHLHFEKKKQKAKSTTKLGGLPLHQSKLRVVLSPCGNFLRRDKFFHLGKMNQPQFDHEFAHIFQMGWWKIPRNLANAPIFGWAFRDESLKHG